MNVALVVAGTLSLHTLLEWAGISGEDAAEAGTAMAQGWWGEHARAAGVERGMCAAGRAPAGLMPVRLWALGRRWFQPHGRLAVP